MIGDESKAQPKVPAKRVRKKVNKEIVSDLRQDASDTRQDESDIRQDTSDIRQDESDNRQDASDTRQDVSDARQDASELREGVRNVGRRKADSKQKELTDRQMISEVHTLALDTKLTQLVVSVDEYQETAKIAIAEIRHERYWRRIVALLMGGFAVFILVVGIVLIFQGNSINRTTKSTNSIADDVRENQVLIRDQQQKAIDGQQAATRLVNNALQAISDNNQAQLDNLRKDLQELAKMLQEGVPIPSIPSIVPNGLPTTGTSLLLPQTTLPSPSNIVTPTSLVTTTTTSPPNVVCSLLKLLC